MTRVAVVNVAVRHRPEASIRIVVGRRRIREEHHAIVAEHGITRRRVTAILRRCSGDDDRVDAPFAQDDVEVRAEEAAVAMLLDHVLAGRRGEIGIDVHSRRAVHQGIPIGDRRVQVVEEAHVAAVAAMHMRRIDHAHAGRRGPSSGPLQASGPWRVRPVFPSERRRRRSRFACPRRSLPSSPDRFDRFALSGLLSGLSSLRECAPRGRKTLRRA